MIRRLAHVCLDVGLALLFGLVVLAVVGAWRLSQGPVSLGFLMPYVEHELALLESPYAIRVDDIELAWAGWPRPVDVVLVGTTARDPDGAVVAEIPRIAVVLAFRPLTEGRLAPTALELIGPAVSVVRDEAGRIRLGFGAAEPGGAAASTFALEGMLGDAEPGSLLGSLTRASVMDGRLAVEDRRLGLRWSAPRATLALRRAAGGLEGRFDFEARLGGATTALEGRFQHRPAGAGTDLAVTFGGLEPARLAAALGPKAPALAGLEAVAAPLGGRLSARLGPDGGIVDASFEVAAGPGALVHPDLPDGRLDLRSATGLGVVEDGGRRVRVDDLKADFGRLRVRVAGELRAGDAGTAATARAELEPLALGELAAYWPAEAAVGARRWILANLNEGEIAAGTADLALRWPADGGAPEIDRVDVRLELARTVVHFFRPLPPIVGTSAGVRITADRAEIDVRRGFLGDLEVSEGRIEMTELSTGPGKLALETALRGPIASALAVLDHERLGYASRLGIRPAAVVGTADVRLRARFPLLAALEMDQVAIGAAGRLEGLGGRGSFLGRDLEGGSLALTVDGEGLVARGQASVAGIPADIVWTERFAESGPFRRRYDVAARLGATDRARLGLDLAPLVAGPVDVAATYRVAPGGERSAEGRLDLAAAALSLDPLDYRKPAGAPASAGFALAFAGEAPSAIRIDRLHAAGLEGRARLTLGPGGHGVRRIDVERLVIGEGTDVAGSIERTASDGLAVDVVGRRLDAAPLLRAARREGEEEQAAWPSLTVDARLDRLAVPPGVALEDARVRLDRRSGAWHAIDLDGRLASGKPVTARFRTDPNGHELSVESGDAGRVLAALGITDNIRQGGLRLAARRPPDAVAGPWRGRLVVEDFVIADAPALARALRLASFGSISEALGGAGVRFDRLEMPFTYRAPRLAITNARALGASLGITGQGRLDVEAETIDLDGSLVPAYQLNSLLGRLPGIGQIFSAEKGGGLFAATYRVSGPLASPAIRINPLAAVAPGFLRGLLQRFGRAGEDVQPEPLPNQ